MSMVRGVTVIKMLLAILMMMLFVMVVFITMSTMEKHSRDTKRITDIEALHKALSIYQTLYGNFPISKLPIKISGRDIVSTALLNSDSIKSPARDPMHPSYSYTYSTNTIGNDFTIQFCLESDYIRGYAAGCNNYIKP